MKFFKNIFGFFWFLWTLFFMMLTFVLGGISAIIVWLVKKLFNVKKSTFYVPRFGSIFVQKSCFYKPQYIGLENLDPNLQCIFLVNHQSSLDPFLVSHLYPHNTKVLAKAEFKYYPFINIVLNNYGIAVNRTDSNDTKKAMEKMSKYILENGYCINIYPEGTRNRKDYGLLKFKSGAFRLSMASGIPVVPIIIQNLANFHHPSLPLMWPGKVKIKIEEAIYPDGLALEDYKSKVKEIMFKAFDDISKGD